jgi:hypothetical protein
MRWEKLGIVLKPDVEWGSKRSMVPTPVLLDENTIRVFVTLCDADNVGRPAFVDVDAHDPKKVLRFSQQPIMDVGEPGAFDQHGVVPSCIVRDSDGRLLMYYSGFQRFETVPYKIFTGLAISEDNGESFVRHLTTPILGESDSETMFRCAGYVDRSGSRYRMWYIAGSEWETVSGKLMPRYSLRYAESMDGIAWPSDGVMSMDLTDPDEHGFGRPWLVIDDHGMHHLYYSVRRISLAAYRLGYAQSVNGLQWNRLDAQMGLDVSPGSSDSNAISFTSVITVAGNTWCFYNGNGFGEDGFAVARLVDGVVLKD